MNDHGALWKDDSLEGLSVRIAGLLASTEVDESGLWRERLLSDILSLISSVHPTTPASVPTRKPKFTLGTSDSLDDLSLLDNGSESNRTERGTCTVGLQTDLANLGPLPRVADTASVDEEVLSKLVRRLKTGGMREDFARLDDREILHLMNLGHLKQRDLEAKLGGDLVRAIALRRAYLNASSSVAFDDDLPYRHYDYSLVQGACCENVVGYIPIPTGVAGPLTVNGRRYVVPMSTTEGALVASTNRGCRAVSESGGATAYVYSDVMTRAPVVQFETAKRALEVKKWLENSLNFEKVKSAFDSTSSYGKLQSLTADPYGRRLYVRFEATTGDAMGMNMVSKGVNAAMILLKKTFPDMGLLSLSGNYCVDKKASSMNWIKGRGKSVVSEVVVPAKVVRSVLKTDVESMCRLAEAKLLVGSSMACVIGGWNAHAANVVAAIFLATGQDAAQVVSSSMCLTSLEKTANGDLYASCTMRCLEVGTVGGGTILPAQKSSLKMLDCDGASAKGPGENAKRLAEIICSTVLAGELSLMAAQCTDDLIKSHLRLNRSTVNLFATSKTGTELCASVPCALDECSGSASKSQSSTRLAVTVRGRPGSEKSARLELNCSNIL